MITETDPRVEAAIGLLTKRFYTPEAARMLAPDFLSIIDAADRARGIPQMLSALGRAANQFDFYAQQHLAKTPPDEAKAKTNSDWAMNCRAALTNAWTNTVAPPATDGSRAPSPAPLDTTQEALGAAGVAGVAPRPASFNTPREALSRMGVFHPDTLPDRQTAPPVSSAQSSEESPVVQAEGVTQPPPSPAPIPPPVLRAAAEHQVSTVGDHEAVVQLTERVDALERSEWTVTQLQLLRRIADVVAQLAWCSSQYDEAWAIVKDIAIIQDVQCAAVPPAAAPAWPNGCLLRSNLVSCERECQHRYIDPATKCPHAGRGGGGA